MTTDVEVSASVIAQLGVACWAGHPEVTHDPKIGKRPTFAPGSGSCRDWFSSSAWTIASHRGWPLRLAVVRPSRSCASWLICAGLGESPPSPARKRLSARPSWSTTASAAPLLPSTRFDWRRGAASRQHCGVSRNPPRNHEGSERQPNPPRPWPPLQNDSDAVAVQETALEVLQVWGFSPLFELVRRRACRPPRSRRQVSPCSVPWPPQLMMHADSAVLATTLGARACSYRPFAGPRWRGGCRARCRIWRFPESRGRPHTHTDLLRVGRRQQQRRRPHVHAPVHVPLQRGQHGATDVGRQPTAAALARPGTRRLPHAHDPARGRTPARHRPAAGVRAALGAVQAGCGCVADAQSEAEQGTAEGGRVRGCDSRRAGEGSQRRQRQTGRASTRLHARSLLYYSPAHAVSPLVPCFLSTH